MAGTAKARRRDAAFRAVADVVRREILEMLRGGERTAGEIAGAFDMSWPAISRHLRLLRAAGLVSVRTEGRERHYSLDRTRLRESIGGWVAHFDAMWAENLQALKRELEGPSHQRGGR